MASGNIGATSSNQYIVGNLSWSATTNVEGNYSDVYAELRMWRTNSGYTTSGTGSWNLTIDGTVFSVTEHVSLTYNSNTLIISGSKRVYHNADGSKSISISATGGISGTSYTSTNCSGTANLDTIPRASTPTLGTNPVTMGNSVTITTNRASTSFTHTIKYTFGNSSGTLATGITDSYTWKTSISLASEIPSATSGIGSIICETYSGGTLVGTKSISITLLVPASVVPTIGSFSVYESNQKVANNVEGFVQNQSIPAYTVGGAAGAYGSTISSYHVTSYDGKVYNYSVYSLGTVTSKGTLTITAYVIDSRGRQSATSTVTITVLQYNPPVIGNFSVVRCDSGGNPNELGTYVKVVRTGTVSSLKPVTAEDNYIRAIVQYRDRAVGGEYTIANACTVTKTSTLTAVTSTPIILSGFPITSAYDFQFLLTDVFNTTISTTQVPTGIVVMSWGKTGVGIGKVWTQGALDVGGDAYVSGNVYMNGNTLFSNFNNNGISTDLNAMVTSGAYRLGNSYTNGPTGVGYGQLLVIHGAADTITQIISDYASGHMYWRSGNPTQVGGSGTWKAWQEFYHSGNVVYGSNSYGYWIQYPNGIMEIWQAIPIGTYTISYAWGNQYSNGSAALLPNFPVSFVDIPVVNMSFGNDSSWSAWLVQQSKPTTTTPPSYELCRPSPVTMSGLTIYYHATGRWK